MTYGANEFSEKSRGSLWSYLDGKEKIGLFSRIVPNPYGDTILADDRYPIIEVLKEEEIEKIYNKTKFGYRGYKKDGLENLVRILYLKKIKLMDDVDGQRCHFEPIGIEISAE